MGSNGPPRRVPPHTGSSATNISPTGGKSHRGPLLPRASGLTNLHSAPAYLTARYGRTVAFPLEY